VDAEKNEKTRKRNEEEFFTVIDSFTGDREGFLGVK
jgi:hypothetical protein